MRDGVVMGKTAAGEDVVLTYEQRRQDTYVIGVNGTGKTTLLREIAYSDMRQDPKHGLCVIDPHGDLIDDIIAMVPEERVNDVILFDPSDEEFPFCLNLFAPAPRPEEIGRVASEIVAIFRKIFGAGWTPEIEGVVQNVTLTLLARPAEFRLNGEPWIAAMDEIPALLAMERVEEGDEKQPPWRRRVQTYRSQFYQLLQQQDQIPVWEFWTYSFDPLTPRPRSELTFAVLNQVRRFLANPAVRNIVAQTQSKLDLYEVMNQGKILLVNLSKGKLGESNSAFLGSVIVAKLVVAVFARSNDPPESRRPFHIIVDEFQNFAISSFPMLLSEARKYNVDLVVAHQYRDQLRDWVQGATVNAGNVVCFRLGGDDALEMARGFDTTPPEPDAETQPVYNRVELEADALGVGMALYRTLTQWGSAALRREGESRNLIPGFLQWVKALATSSDICTGAYTSASLHELLSQWIGRARGTGIEDWAREAFRTLPRAIQFRASAALEPATAAGEVKPPFYKQEFLAWIDSVSIPEPATDSLRQLNNELAAREREIRRFVQSESQHGRLYREVPGRPRLYSDMHGEITNQLSHLPNFHARCKLAGSAAAPIEQTFHTDEWPEDYHDPSERAARYDRNLERTRKNTRRDFTEQRQKVVQEFRRRYEAMLASIGIEWTPNEPLPTPEILYEEDD